MRSPVRLSLMAAVAITGLTLTSAGASAAVSAHSAGARGTAAASGTKVWQARFTAAGRGATGGESAVSPDGSVVFVPGAADKRVREAGGIPNEAVVLAYHAATGAVLWRASYNPSQRSNSLYFALATSPDGSAVYVTGGTAPAAGQRPAVVTTAYSAATGAVIWTNTSVTAGPGGSIAVSPDGSTVFITTLAGVAAYKAATGTVLWTASAGGVSQVVASPDGSTVFALGEHSLAAYNAATGATRWGITPAQLTAESMAVSPDGSKAVVTGLTFGAGGDILRAAAYDPATGSRLWSRQFKGAHGSSIGYAAAFGPDSATVYIAGATRNAGVNNIYSAGIWACNAATGVRVWQRTLPAVSLDTTGIDRIAVSPDGSRVFVTGLGSAASAAGAFSTAAVDAATGAKLWALGYNLAGNHWGSFPASIEVSPDGTRVFVSGDLNSPTPAQTGSMVTVAYSS